MNAPEAPSAMRQQIVRQVRQYVESLRAAGVEWLPAPAATPLPSSPTPVAQPAVPTVRHDTHTVERDLLSLADSPSETGLSVQQRRESLQLLAEQVSQCTRCNELACTRTQTVFADGPLGAELCFVGEAPGADEDAQGLPFVGAAGQLLNKIIAACGLRREEVYICNILKCRPPGNRTPTAIEAANCREFLERQFDLVQPKFICALGGCAATNLLQTTKSIGQLRGRFHDFRGIPVICTYHPAYLLPHRSPEKKRDVWQDMKMLMVKMGRTIPEHKGGS